VWVAGNARSQGSFSATVKLLTAVKDVGGACVYGSNYPPVGEYSSSDASKIVFTGTPEYDVALLHESGSLVITTTDSPLLIPASYTVQSFTDKTAAPGKLACIPSTVYDLTVSASSFCAGGTGVTFALSGTESGRIYRLYKDGTTVVSTLTGDGNAATFCEAVSEMGTYTARAAALPEYCPAVMTGSYTVASVPSPEAPTMGGSGTYCDVAATITATAGHGGNGIRWDHGSTAALHSVISSGTYHAVTTSETGCTSDAASITVLVTQPASPGEPPTPCGCAGNYWDVEGVCTPRCPGCADLLGPGYQYAYVPQVTVADVPTACSQFGDGWALPSFDEYNALRESQASLPFVVTTRWIFCATQCSSTAWQHCAWEDHAFWQCGHSWDVHDVICVKSSE
jgi:hypothetical protein